jgi:2-amino-4-hydroxy-6-hydroxymethyldihydropteridine diphosphokinase
MPLQIIYLSLGSNVGDRADNLRHAIAVLEDAGVRVRQVSSIYETEPVDLREQPWFLNCVVQAETKLPPMELLKKLRRIETLLGSKKDVPKGPRLIDLDILLYGDESVNTPELRVPHPRMHLRRFVLVPLTEIAPGLRHPSWNATAADLLARTPDKSVVRKYEQEKNITQSPQSPEHRGH